MDENDRDQGERRRCARRSIDRSSSPSSRLSLSAVMVVGRRLEGESRAEDASEGKREEGGDTVSHGEPAGRESHDGQHNREHADRNQGSVGWDQFPRSIGADFVQGTALRSLRQLQFPTKGRLYQSKGQTVARSSTVRSILASGGQKELRQAKAEREPGSGQTLQRTKRSQVR